MANMSKPVMLERYECINHVNPLFGRTALGKFVKKVVAGVTIPTPVFQAQLDDLNHQYSHGWHDQNALDWMIQWQEHEPSFEEAIKRITDGPDNRLNEHMQFAAHFTREAMSHLNLPKEML